MPPSEGGRKGKNKVQTAKVLVNSKSQAIMLPQEYSFNTDEVYVNRIGDALILTPVNRLSAVFEESLRGFTDDFLADGRISEYPTERQESL